MEIKNIKMLLITLFLLVNAVVIHFLVAPNSEIVYQNNNHPNVQTTCFEIKINGESMENTFKDNKTYSFEIYKYKNIDEIKRGDIIAFKREDHDVIKRVIALPNDTIEVKEINGKRKIYLNNQLLKEPYIKDPELPVGRMGLARKVTVSPNCVFVAGDNRNFSTDSLFYYQPNIPFKDIYFAVISAKEI